MTAYSAFIFDLDGTLIDSAPDIAEALNIGFAQNGWPKLEAHFVEKFLGNGPRRLIIDILDELGVTYDELTLQQTLQCYQQAYLANPAGHTRIFPHVREDLEALKSAGIKLGICTNKTHAITAKVLQQLGLSELFDVALGADVVPACKPDPKHLLAVADAMNLVSGGWAYVGDTPIDQQAAVGADVPFFVVPWGGGPEVEISAKQRLSRLADLLQV
ncbi:MULTISPECIES: HAD family hydrolase [Acinetobacter]|uniref:HAD family hydrolase n=1 Tax=Acinetobacter TaxID=469 RepID=UPI0004D50642|nr:MULTISPECIES: HAD-IA family hydrolase [unclassified Acinetobacter]KEC83523.1 phosphoglycolate phosphatase [Acinetobacter sp. ETR1]WEE38034.1 HAD-IA family hydrolase [Acinetobacter sp. TAC-1]